MKNKKGFTLVELIAVIAILAVLVLVALPNVLGVFNKSIEEVMKIEETQATDAGNLYVRDHCGRTAKSKTDRSKCRNDVTTQKIEDKVYFCLSEIRKKGYIDEIKYKGNTKCDGIVLYDYDDEEVKFSEGKTYLICDNDLYVTPELAEKEEEVIKAYKEIINDCPNSSYEEAPEPEPNPNPEPNPTPTNSIYTVTLDNAGGTSTGNNQIYLKYGEGWYSDSEGINSIEVVNIPVKTGNEFKGYYTGENGTGTKVIDENGLIQAGEEKVFNTNGTLYASWMASTYKLTLDNDGATTKGTEAIYEKYGIGWYSEQAGTNALTSIVVPVKKGYTFNGYSLNGVEIVKENGEINENTSTAINADSEALARYTPRTYSVILNTEGADTPGTPAIYLKYNIGWYSNYEATDSISKITVPQKSKHFFEGYYTGEDGEGTQVIDKDGNIKNGNTKIFSNETNTGVLYAKWKEDYACSSLNITYIGYVSTSNGSATAENVLKNKKETRKNNALLNDTIDFQEFALTNDYISQVLGVWRIYAQDDNIYYSTKLNAAADELIPLSNLSWDWFAKKTFYIYSKDCIKRPSTMKYVGSVFSSGNNTIRHGIYGVNKGKNIKGNMTDITGRKDFGDFGIKGDYVKQVLGEWRLYAEDDDLFYSEKETTNINDLKPLSVIEWTWSTNKKIYIYKKEKVDTPSNYTYVGSVFTSGRRDVSPEIYGVNKTNKEMKNITDVNGRTDFGYFGVKGSHNSGVYGIWRLYAEDDDLFYSEKETTKISDLTPLSTVEWNWGANKKIYIYKKGKVDTPSNYTYIGSVFNSGTRTLDAAPEVYGINKVKNIKGNITDITGRKDFGDFGIKGDYVKQVLGEWRVYAKDDDLFYSEKETTNINDLKPLSVIEWKWSTNKKIYIYKKGKVDTPSNYTYVGSVFTSGRRDVSPEIYGVNKTNKEMKNITDVNGRTDFGYFGVKGSHNSGVYGIWRLYAEDDDLFYSEKETTTISDLTPLSTVEWNWGVNKKIYIYKKGKVDTPSNYTYIGSVFNSGTRTLDAAPEVYGINKVKNIKGNITDITGRKDFGDFGIKGDYVKQVLGEWRVYAEDDDLFYSEKETTNINDLKLLSYVEWTWSTNKKIYIYKKGKVDTPSNYMYVGSVFTSGTREPEVYVNNKIQNVNEYLGGTNTNKNYNDFSIKYTSGSWNILSNNNLFYSEKETTDESNLKSFSKLTWGYNVNKKYYIYKKK